ncbi:hypothetical protein ACS0TY_000963 [Phlomoides rotata]
MDLEDRNNIFLDLCNLATSSFQTRPPPFDPYDVNLRIQKQTQIYNLKHLGGTTVAVERIDSEEDESRNYNLKHLGGTTAAAERIDREPRVAPEKCLQWLDSHPQRSVLYISFGSQNSINPSQMIVLALGLEDSKKPFIWVIRTPTGFNLKTESKFLPDGFEERFAQSNQGLVVHEWAPQLEILCHRSIGPKVMTFCVMLKIL